MDIRPLTPLDLDRVAEIDATIQSNTYLHVEQIGQGLSVQWSIQPRDLRPQRIQPNRIDDELWFSLRQISSGIEEGTILLAEHEEQPVALAAARLEAARGVLRVLDVRVDFDFRRQGLGTALVFQMIAQARAQGLRALAIETRADQFAANRLLEKLAFSLSGMDTRRQSNHDQVKESATLFWYAALD